MGVALVGVAVLAGAIGRVGGDAALAADAPPGAVPPARVVVPDAHSPRPRRAVHDVTEVLLDAHAGVLDVRTRFRRPLAEGMFECVHVYVDCDADAATGIEGADLWVRAAIGSRYQPTAAPAPAAGMPAPATLLRASWSRPQRLAVRNQAARVGWIHQHERIVEPPTVDGPDLLVRIPLALLVRQGLHYNRFVRVRLEAEGSCSEHPIALEYLCDDEGMPVVLDGRDAEWSGQATVADATGELHPDASEVDLAALSVDHDATHVHALVRLASPGFGDEVDDLDVVDDDRVTVALEPLAAGGRYMDYVERTVRGRRATDGAAIGPRVVELSIPRVRAQTAFRVAAWSDAIRIDRVPQWGTVDVGIPPEALRAR